MKPVLLNAAAGVRNNTSLERFAKGDLASAVNIDIDETGAVSRRLGTVPLLPGAAHSMWSDGVRAFFVQGGVLRQLFPDMTTRAVQAGITGARVNYMSINGSVYWSDEDQSGVVTDGLARRWGLQPPPQASTLNTFGELPAGTYGITTTYMRDDGHESGASQATWVVRDGTQGVLVVLEKSPDALATFQRVYMTLPDSETFFFVGEVTDNAASFEISSLPSYGMELRTQFKGPAPAGHIVGYDAGRAFVAQDNFLFVSDPFEYELFDLRTGFFGFDSRISVFAPVADGIFVATQNETYFMAGTGPDNYKLTSVLPYGGVEGTTRIVRGDLIEKSEDTTNVGMWMSKQGVCLGANGGRVKNLTVGRYTMPDMSAQGASLLKIKDGTPQFLVTTL